MEWPQEALRSVATHFLQKATFNPDLNTESFSEDPKPLESQTSLCRITSSSRF